LAHQLSVLRLTNATLLEHVIQQLESVQLHQSPTVLAVVMEMLVLLVIIVKQEYVLALPSPVVFLISALILEHVIHQLESVQIHQSPTVLAVVTEMLVLLVIHV